MVRRTPHRPPTSHPVSSYRSIAISFLALTLILVGLVFFMSTKKAIITIETRPEPKTFDGTLTFSDTRDGQSVVAFITSTTVVVTSTFTPTGAIDVPGKSRGEVRLVNTSAQTQRLVVNTRVQTSTGLVYRLTSAVTVPARGSVNAGVLADLEGGAYDIAPTRFTIPGLSAARQEVVYAESSAPFTGGVSTVGAVGEDDMVRLRDQVNIKAEQQLMSQVPATPTSALRSFFTTRIAEETSARVGSMVSEVSATHTVRVVLIQYEKEAIRSALQAMVDKQLSLQHTMFHLDNDDTVIQLKECSLKDARCTAEAHVSGLESLRQDSEVVEAVHFAGKTKDEVRRYVQTLPYVSWVDVTISPSWQRTVPELVDNITIQLKQTETGVGLDTK